MAGFHPKLLTVYTASLPMFYFPPVHPRSRGDHEFKRMKLEASFAVHPRSRGDHSSLQKESESLTPIKYQKCYPTIIRLRQCRF